MRYLSATCTKCEGTVKISIGTMEVSEAVSALRSRMMGECTASILPHVEMGYMLDYYRLEKDDQNIPIVREAEDTRETEEAFLARYAAEGRTLVTTAELPRGLTHLGFGEFTSDTHDYVRHNSPGGKRYYEAIPKR